MHQLLNPRLAPIPIINIALFDGVFENAAFFERNVVSLLRLPCIIVSQSCMEG
jgi:hypothetical protein